ncbi:formylglycine-generating enzyme family protein [Massilia brevitalea]|uniref:formylglycine-generating enzyme family protein n=1 Tax=Massilia brevitalea TaxID=442526 RepID=UPI002739F3FA|nr:formylglycine-generating enzyme family protein [Massilia brevitalea]
MKQAFLSLSLACAALAVQAAPTLPPMATIPAGSFTMGSLEPVIGDGSHNPRETPPHTVQVKSFRMARFETTVAQFREFVAVTGYRTEEQCWVFARGDGIKLADVKWDAPSVAPGDFHPVTCVSQRDATAYVDWLAQQTGRRFRLPSEAEWEYAARAGTSTKYPSGDASDVLCAYANMKDRRFRDAVKRDHGLDMPVTDCDDGAGYTTVVGMYPANAFGLYDVIGNVAEWVADCQHPDYAGAPADGSAWTRGCEGEYFITRGGAYSGSRLVLRSAARGHGGRTNASSLGEGFRLAEDLGDCSGSRCTEGDPAFAAALAAAQGSERARRSGQGGAQSGAK